MLGSLVRDQIACQVVGSSAAHNAIVREYALRESLPGACTVVGASQPARAEWAALANATAGHGFEMDDTHAQALSHPSCVLVPTVFAVAEQRDSRGHEFLTALALGLETTVRVGLAVMPSMLDSRGFHETCVTGVFGSALAAGRLSALTEGQLAAALGIAGSHASGTIEYGRSGGEVKRLHAGLGAMGGIRSASLALAGLTGPRFIFEGEKGVLQAVAADPKPDAVVADLGSVWHLSALCAREFAAPFSMQGPIRALKEIVATHRVKSTDIARIVVGVDRFSAGHLGTLGPQPVDISGAQYSLQYSLAMTVVLGGNGHADYRRVAELGFADPEILRLAGLVEVEADAEATAAFPINIQGVVAVQCVNGRTYRARSQAMSSWDTAFVADRFLKVVGEAYGPVTASRVDAAIDALLDDRPVRGVLGLLARRTPSGGPSR